MMKALGWVLLTTKGILHLTIENLLNNELNHIYNTNSMNLKSIIHICFDFGYLLLEKMIFEIPSLGFAKIITKKDISFGILILSK